MKKAFLITAIVLGLATSGFAGEQETENPHRGKGGYSAANASYHEKDEFERPDPHHMRNVTPYGDFCPNCSVYGVRYKHEDQVDHKHAVAAIAAYFAKRGLTIGNVRGMGRFIKVDVFKEKELVDRIVFDRRTGRIRSIY